ncbi:hypothetical protein ACC785_39085, partial [Rhizobium ruizarguesonis]
KFMVQWLLKFRSGSRGLRGHGIKVTDGKESAERRIERIGFEVMLMKIGAEKMLPLGASGQEHLSGGMPDDFGPEWT